MRSISNSIAAQTVREKGTSSNGSRPLTATATIVSPVQGTFGQVASSTAKARATNTISVTPRLTMIQPTVASLSRLKLSPHDGQGSGGVNQLENSLAPPQRGQRRSKPRSRSVGGLGLLGAARSATASSPCPPDGTYPPRPRPE